MVSGEEREETLGIKQAARQDRTDGRPSTPPTDRLFRNASLQSVGVYVVVHVSQSFIHVHDLITLLLRIALHVALHRRLCLSVCLCLSASASVLVPRRLRLLLLLLLLPRTT